MTKNPSECLAYVANTFLQHQTAYVAYVADVPPYVADVAKATAYVANL